MSRSDTATPEGTRDGVRQEADAAAPNAPSAGVGWLAGRRHKRLTGMGMLLALLVLSCALSVLIGAKVIAPAEVWTALWDPTHSANSLIIHELRIPRTVLGVLAGAALGLAGALMQGHTRNPIADPSILGISQGAGLAVVISVFSFDITSLLGFVWFSFAGALLGALAVFAIGSIGRGGANPVTLALAGAAISFLLQGITSALVLLDRQSLDTYRFWKVGSIAITESAVIWQILPFLAVGFVMGLANARGLNALSLGEDVARSLGHRVRLSRGLGIAAIAVLVGGSVAVCGPISFVGLVAPHVARFFTGAEHRWLLPFSALLGSSLVLLADVLGRVVVRPSEIQVGVMLAMVGAPFFIALVRRRKLVRL